MNNVFYQISKTNASTSFGLVKKLRCVLLIALSLVFFGSCSSSQNHTTKIAVCASSYSVLTQIKEEYRIKTGREVELIQGASGRLTTQIIQGAPYDIFISADLSFGEIIKNKLGLPNKVEVLTKNQLALWKKSDKAPQTIALANPKIAPFGRIANNELGLLNIEVKEVFGESISQVNHYILSQSVDWAYTSYPSIKNNPDLKGTLMIVKTAPILEQEIICLNKDKETIAFFEYLFSEKSQQIFLQNGFIE
jgi:molybdate transport system substrate-binding protein